MPHDTNLEPRVATLETELRQVVKAVGDLTGAFSSFAKRVEDQIQALAVSVERAQAPKATNWSAIIGTGVSVILMLITIGGLVLYPMGRELNALEAWREKHTDLELHPVGRSRIDALENALTERTAFNAKSIRDLDTKLQKEYSLVNATVEGRVADLDRRLQAEFKLAIDRIDEVNRLGAPITRERLAVIEKEIEGLRNWRSAEGRK